MPCQSLPPGAPGRRRSTGSRPALFQYPPQRRPSLPNSRDKASDDIMRPRPSPRRLFRQHRRQPVRTWRQQPRPLRRLMDAQAFIARRAQHHHASAPLSLAESTPPSGSTREDGRGTDLARRGKLAHSLCTHSYRGKGALCRLGVVRPPSVAGVQAQAGHCVHRCRRERAVGPVRRRFVTRSLRRLGLPKSLLESFHAEVVRLESSRGAPARQRGSLRRAHGCTALTSGFRLARRATIRSLATAVWKKVDAIATENPEGFQRHAVRGLVAAFCESSTRSVSNVQPSHNLFLRQARRPAASHTRPGAGHHVARCDSAHSHSWSPVLQLEWMPCMHCGVPKNQLALRSMLYIRQSRQAAVLALAELRLGSDAQLLCESDKGSFCSSCRTLTITAMTAVQLMEPTRSSPRSSPGPWTTA